MKTQDINQIRLLDAVDRLGEVDSLCRALDMALENDDSQNSEALRQLLLVISDKVVEVRAWVDEARAEVKA